MVRPPCEKQNARKGNWNSEEDGNALAYVPKHRTGLKKCGRSCKHKWSSNHQRPDKKHEMFTPQEEELIINLHAAIGSRWSIIAQQLPGRTDSDVKNYWNSRLKKKLQEMGIDHVTHKPFSQIIADYGNIGAFPIPTARTCYLNGDHANNSLLQNQEKSPVQFSNYNSTSPKSFLSNNINNYGNDSQSIDLLTQLQSITLVKQPPNCPENDIVQQAQFYNEYPSSSSSSSPPVVNEGRIPSSGFSWRDFLIEDTVPPVIRQEHIEEVAPLGYPIEVGNEMKKEVNKYNNNMTVPSKLEASETCAANSGSFVEAILDEEHDMFLDFPSLLEEPFYY